MARPGRPITNPAKIPLTDQEVQLWRILEDLAGGQSLLDFIPRITKNFDKPTHLRAVADALARAKHAPIRALISVPPRHSKTETVLHGVAWWLSERPQDTLAYVSYAANIAQSKSRRMRDMAIRAGVDLRQDSQATHEWRTTAGGGLLATGVGGPLTSQGANVLIVDDPIKNREEAESTVIRDKLWDWFTSTAMTRVEPGGSVLVVHTRWHDDDLIGRLCQDASWEYINLPALAGEDSPEGARALWPERWPVSELVKRRREVGEYDWASLFMGQPRPRGGRMFREPVRYRHPLIADLSNQARIIIGVDPAATEKSSADFSVAVVMAVMGKPGTISFRADVLEVVRVQEEIPKFVARLGQLSKKWAAPLGIESVGGFKAVPQMIKMLDKTARVFEVTPLGDKFTRALPVAAAWNDGRVRVPAQADWLADFLGEVTRFTGVKDAHDDQVDAMAHAFNTAVQFVPVEPRDARVRWLPFG